MKFQTVCGIAALLSGTANALSCSDDSGCSWDNDGKKCVNTGMCGCNSNADCTGMYTICDTAGKLCHGCLTNADCTSSYAPVCNKAGSNNYCSSSCTSDSDCQKGEDKNFKCKDSVCQHGMTGCEWEEKDSENFGTKLMVGNIVGIVIGVITVIAVSLPLCCGVAKDKMAGSCEMPKIIAGIAIGVGIFIMFVPMMGLSSATEGAIEDVCSGSDCECSDKNKEDMRAAVGAIGFFVTYIWVFGWASVVLGILAASLGCCVCCKCCGPLKDQPAPAQAPVQGAVVGAPVGNDSSK